MTTHDVKHLRTEAVENKDHILAACDLVYHYCLDPIRARDLEKILNTDWWKCAELLTDLIPYGKINRSIREAVAFHLLVQTNPHKKNGYHLCDMAMSLFAHKALYPVDLVVEWCDYRIRRACEDLAMIDKVIWQVHDRNVPLQVELRNVGFRVMEYNREDETMIFAR